MGRYKMSWIFSQTHRIFEGRVAITSLGGSYRTLAPYTVVRWNAVEAVSVQGYRSTPFSVVEPRLPFSHYELEMITVKISDRYIPAKRMLEAHLAVSLRSQLRTFSVIILAHLRILTMSRNVMAVNFVAMHWTENCNLRQRAKYTNDKSVSLIVINPRL